MSFSNRVGASIVGALFGILLIPGSIALHAWNEYRTIHRSRGLAEAADVVVSIADPQVVDDKLESKFVHLSGFADTEEVLRDELFGVRQRAIHLARRVEMYQWVEEEEENSEGHKYYEYHQEWHPDRVNSSGFHKSGYDNPPLKFQSLQHTAEHVTVGAYQLNDALKADMHDWTRLALNQAAILETIGPGSESQFLVDDDLLYWAPEVPDPQHPEIGDTRIEFSHVGPADVSLVGRLTGNSFDAFTTSNGERIQRLYTGVFSAEEVMQKLMTENTILAWIIRFAGLVMCVIGFTVMLRPLAVVVSWIPVLGELTGFALFVAGALCALAVSLTTISIAWLAVRPLLSITLLVIVGLAGFAIVKLSRSHRDEPPVIA